MYYLYKNFQYFNKNNFISLNKISILFICCTTSYTSNMKKQIIFAAFFAAMLITIFSCKEKISSENAIDTSHVLNSKVLTAEEQAKLTPAMVIDSLKKGNQEYTEDRLVIRNIPARIRDAAAGQYPAAVVLSCMDSRVPVEDVFHQGIGDVFVIRVAGNIINEDILGSMEYGCKVSGSKVIVVLGHEYCGAIKSAISDVKLGNITALLQKIQPAIKSASSFKGDKSASNGDYVDTVCKKNVLLSIDEIRKGSPILKEMEDKKEIAIVGAVYHIKTGKVEFF